MVISDNYLFTNDFGYENLKSILKNLLPETLKVTFDLSIIGYDKTNIQFNIKNEYNEIKKFLEFNFSYPINLSIIQVYNHKRSIYSNLARFNTDKGFSLFRNSKIEDRNETTLEYCPNGSKTLSDSPMTSFKFEIEKIRKKTETLSQNKPANFNKVIGNKNNRLFNIQKNRSITT